MKQEADSYQLSAISYQPEIGERANLRLTADR